jgi:pimeloyl-ACP methyl ester carboxylesterase
MLLTGAGVFTQAPAPARAPTSTQDPTAAQSESPRAALASGKFITVDGGNLWYEECGAADHGTNVVLLHDGLVDSVTWDAVWAPLCEKYRVVRYDRRGYGRSDPAKAPFVPEVDLYKIMREVHMDRAIIVGNSSGGGLALDFAIAHPEMVQGLFLIGPVVHGMASSDYFNERGAKNSAPMVEHGDAKAAATNWSEDRFIIGGQAPVARKQLYDALVANPQVLTAGGALEIRPSPSTVTRLSEIHVPTLILVGEDDIGDVFAYSGAIEAAVPLASFEVMKHTGHLIQIQRPAELVARFNKFVAMAERKEISLTDAQLTVFVGHYTLSKIVVTVLLKNHHLILEFSGGPYYWLFPSSETKFFMRTDDAEIEFVKNALGNVLEMLIHNSDGSLIRCPLINLTTSH